MMILSIKNAREERDEKTIFPVPDVPSAETNSSWNKRGITMMTRRRRKPYISCLQRIVIQPCSDTYLSIYRSRSTGMRETPQLQQSG